MSRVIDASVVVAGLVDSGDLGGWADSVLAEGGLCAPHMMPAEVGNILRRAVLASELSAEVAGLALGDLLSLRVRLFPFEPFADRVWELRDNVTAYDAWYVGLAEAIGAPFVTLDRRLARATGPACEFVLPPR